MIEIKECTKIFSKKKKETIALNNINLKLDNKGLTFVIGKSGSGKSTLLNLLANFDKPTSGSIIYDGANITLLSEKERDEYLFNEVGFVFQAYNLFEELTVKENIALGLKVNPKSQEDNIKRLLEEVHLSGFEDKKVKNLSGGEKQRVALARALIKDPKILLCDEPCGNLDNFNSRIVLDILKKRSENALVVIVSHSLNDAYLYADRIIALNSGNVVSDKYIDEKEQVKDTYVIKDLNNISDEEFDLIIKQRDERKIERIRSRKTLFKDFDKEIIEEKGEKKKIKTNFLKSAWSNLKLIFSKHLKIAMFSIITGLSLGIFSSVYALETFDTNAYNAEAIKLYQSDIVHYVKGSEAKNGYTYGSYLGRATKEDEEVIKEVYDGKFYPRIRGSIHTSLKKLSQLQEIAPKNDVFELFYSAEARGINVVDEEYLKKILRIDKIEYLYDLDINDGFYITDYFADSKCYFDGFKDYDSMITKHNRDVDNQKIDAHNYLKIKGVIKTNYKEEFSSLIKDGQLTDKFVVKKFLSDNNNASKIDYLRTGLNSLYAFNDDFVSDILIQNVFFRVFMINDEIEVRIPHMAASKNIPENTLLMSSATLRSYFYDKKIDEIREFLKTETFEFRIPKIENDGSIYAKQIKLAIREDYNTEIAEEHLNASAYIVSSDIYKDLQALAFFTSGYLFEDDSIISRNDKMREINFMFDNSYVGESEFVSTQLHKFSEVFQILSIVCLTLSLCVMIYYAFSVIKDNKYNIGVLKSLGYKGSELSLFYLTSFILYFLVTTLLYGVVYYSLADILNKVLIGVLINFTTQGKLSNIPFIEFDNAIFIPTMATLLGLTLLFSLVYLFVLRKFKINSIIQNKE